MQRIIIFFFLTLIVPGAVYWASHGFESPGRGIHRFVEEVRAFSGTPPAPETEPAKDDEPEKKPGEPEKNPDEEAPEKPKKDEPEDTGPSRAEQAQSHFDAGRFADAAAIFAGMDARMHALSQLGASLAKAFPRNLPDEPYLVVTTSSGGEFEGFGREDGGQLRLSSPGGRTLSLPNSVIAGRRKLDRPKAIERLARRIASEGVSSTLTGARLFALLQEAFAMDRPDVAAPLLPRVLEIDEHKPFFLSAVRNRAQPAHHENLYRAFGRCAVVEDDGPIHETVTHTPKKLGDGTLVRKKRRFKSSIRSEKALALVKQASPHLAEGKKLHRETVLAGLSGASSATIDRAVRELEKAMGYYEKALEHEDADEIHALLRACSKRAFQLRFWREQIAHR